MVRREFPIWTYVGDAFESYIYVHDEAKYFVTSLDTSEPRGLDEAVYWRIEVLKILQKIASNDDLQNINGIIAAYRDRRLKVEKGQVSYWRCGVMKRALGPPVRGEALSAMLEEWSQEEGRNWVEDAWELTPRGGSGGRWIDFLRGSCSRSG